MAPYTADQVADTLICLARAQGIEISNLKLQKLLYYSQAWNLAFTDQPLFDEEFEAWVHGPVVPKVFRRFKEFRWNTISTHLEPIEDETLKAHLTEILRVYGSFNGRQLERLTHSEGPWSHARRGLEPDVSSHNVIPKASMKDFYGQILHGQK